MYKKNSVPIYRKTKIYAKPTSDNPTIASDEQEIVEESKPRLKAPRVKTPKPVDGSTNVVVLKMSHPDLHIGQGDVRVAAWVAARQPYTIANVLVNELTDENGIVVLNHKCRRNTEILIRARATNTYAGPTHDVMYVSSGKHDKLDIEMRNH